MTISTEDNYRILVVDDMASIHQDFRKILTPEENSNNKRLNQMNDLILGRKAEKSKLPPFKINTASQGQEGLDLIKKSLHEKKPYAVAFIDVQMPPGEDGIETIERIWKKDTQIQIVICTAYAKYSWENLKERFGDTDRLFILKKPFDSIEVIQLACSLSKKWNLSNYMHEQLVGIKQAPNPKLNEMESTINRLKDTVEALSAINKEFENKKR